MAKQTKVSFLQALTDFRDVLWGIGLFSAIINILTLTGSMFMLQIYDRVLPSNSIPTLTALVIVVIGLYGFQAIFDIIRSRVFVRMGAHFDGALTERVYETIIQLPLKMRRTEGTQPIRDLDTVRSFLSSAGPSSLFDLPWIPLYLGVCFLFHFAIGLAATVGAITIISITALTEMSIRVPTRRVAEHGSARNILAEGSKRNNELLYALGMVGRMQGRWKENNDQYSAAQRRVSDITGTSGAIVKVLRILLQSVVLGIGAYLVIMNQASPGIIIAGSIIAARALAPADIAIANWKGFVAARQAWGRIKRLLNSVEATGEVMKLPRPTAKLTVENVSVIPPGCENPVVKNISLTLNAGQVLGIIGPSASGKTSLVKSILGIWKPAAGTIRIDGAEHDQWNRHLLGNHLGYLPQEAQLCDGTIIENISRFETNPSNDAVIKAAKTAGVHDLILSLPKGYETYIGEHGEVLSAGQRQRVGLARALYGDPFLVVLDEPNANLDVVGEEALINAILSVRNRGGIVIVIAHRSGVVKALDHILVLRDGHPIALGPRDKILQPVASIPRNNPFAKSSGNYYAPIHPQSH